MSRNFFIRKLMRRDGLDREEALSEVNNAIETALYDHYACNSKQIKKIEAMHDGQEKEFAYASMSFNLMQAYEDALINELGLEPDYAMQFIDAVDEYTQENPDYITKLMEEEEE